MLTSNLIHGEPYSQTELFNLVQGKNGIPYTVPNQDPYTEFRAGTVEGPLIGGNLSLLTALCGTPWQPRTEGHILFIEDWKEKYYSLDRQFQQLKLAGLFDRIRGLLLCDFSDIEPEPEFDLTEQLRRLTMDIKVPTGYGFSVGHGAQTATLPIGIPAEFDAARGSLTLLESPVL
jgi:muramoyltetrapeptide carboxypeptidase